MKVFTITNERAVLYLKTQICDKLQLKEILNVPDFLQVSSTWYNLQNRAAVLKLCRLQKHPANLHTKNQNQVIMST